ncbi:DUF815 domain-containing protein [Campylobacter sp. RM12640]|uniref:DUF815 domain-containing protein n=1 Tax=unclassified Campylobacter TaxID=2593542 RepID=UPI001D22D078|nr:DUF815 domain-containing protein [Campylobacter sp. RM12637]MBZ7977971.1 DUF815 domain-containing protein [Campylobacter sp. RM12654]MBZ7981822.1 DUF815 domain-containing protein [Campylobacter sp. RM12640]MBZ7983878.1 DUF815 domain-containing protein [Campylobacter sp. RM12647]MBZ7988769.1 DUF815 domain-containing protein [Campylobacter sp. RM12635]
MIALFKEFKAASYRARTSSFKPIKNLDLVDFKDLLFLDKEFNILKNNMNNFLQNKAYQHCLLAGAKGCGKSSLIKAIFNEFIKSDLRIVEVFKEDLSHLRYIIDDLSELEYKFVIFLDDISFSINDDSFKALKPILDGGCEKLSDNIMFILSSNYKNLLKSSNINYQDADFKDESDDRFALKERFGIWLNFYSMSQEQYLSIVKSLFKDEFSDEIKAKALEFANLKGTKNGRIAKQFYELKKDLND